MAIRKLIITAQIDEHADFSFREQIKIGESLEMMLRSVSKTVNISIRDIEPMSLIIKDLINAINEKIDKAHADTTEVYTALIEALQQPRSV